MNMKRWRGALGMVLVVVAAVSTARTGAAQPTPPISAAGDAHQLARQLLDLLVPDIKNGRMAEAMMMSQVAAQPSLKKYQEVIRQWAQSIFASDEFQSAMVKLYEETFPAEDLRNLLAFYRTPTGQHAIALLPQIGQKSLEAGAKIGQRHMPDLVALMQQVDQETKAETVKPDGDQR